MCPIALKKLSLRWGNKYQDEGLLVMRIGLGLMFMIVHGWPKLLAGPEVWANVGSAMPNFGLAHLSQGWGLMATLSQFIGGFCLIMGWMFRPAVAFLAVTMFVAAYGHLSAGEGWSKASHAIEVGIVFIGLLGVGPGAYSIYERRKLAGKDIFSRQAWS